MTQAQEVLKKIFLPQDVSLNGLTANDLAEAYVDIAFLETAMSFLRDEQWLHKDLLPEDVSRSLFGKELLSLSYLKDILKLTSKKEINKTQQKSLEIQNLILGSVQIRPQNEQKIFLTKALQKMSGLFVFETQLQNEKKSQGSHLGLSLYRTFDGLDKIFALDYEADIGMRQDLTIHERLYEGAGVGVQSGYSTVLTALANLSLKPGDRFIDLGSGYGRVGLVVGLMYPEVDFIGYEFVQHRVEIANSSCARLTMTDHVHFHTQDLSLKEFKIPDAEIYYMYDPFSAETYGHVLSQLVTLSRSKKVTIVTKGNARSWLMDIAREERWLSPEEFDSSNLCVFQSR